MFDKTKTPCRGLSHCAAGYVLWPCALKEPKGVNRPLNPAGFTATGLSMLVVAANRLEGCKLDMGMPCFLL